MPEEKRRSLPICLKCPMAYLGRGLADENIVICSAGLCECPYQVGYVDPNLYAVKLCGRRDLTYDDFV